MTQRNTCDHNNHNKLRQRVSSSLKSTHSCCVTFVLTVVEMNFDGIRKSMRIQIFADYATWSPLHPCYRSAARR